MVCMPDVVVVLPNQVPYSIATTGSRKANFGSRTILRSTGLTLGCTVRIVQPTGKQYGALHSKHLHGAFPSSGSCSAGVLERVNFVGSGDVSLSLFSTR